MASLVYVGDVSHAPYGERAAAEVLERCEKVTEHLIERGARLIVVACNTATAQAIELLRERWPHLRFVGVEPGVKPAVALSRTGRIAVMATPATAASARLRRLIDNHAAQAHVHVQPCPELAAAIERGALDGEALFEVLKPSCDGVRDAQVDTVVLGCTHYPFVAGAIRELLGADIMLVDTASAVAEHAASVWHHEIGADARPTTRVLSTGMPETMKRLLRQCPGLEGTEVERVML